MIVPMRVLTVVVREKERDQAVAELGRLGVVHVEPVKPPMGRELEEAAARHTRLRRAVEVLPEIEEAAPSGLEAHEAARRIYTLIHQGKELDERIEALGAERERLLPWGSLDPGQVRTLEGYGVRVGFFRLASSEPSPVIEDAVVRELSRDRAGALVMVMGPKDFSFDGVEVPLPERSLAAVENELAAVREQKQGLGAALASFAGDRKAIEEAALEAGFEAEAVGVRLSMGESAEAGEPLAYLRGYVPTFDEPRVMAVARQAGWAVMARDPAPTDDPPTLTAAPRWARPVTAVLEMIGVVPGYREADVSSLFMIFLTIFFAMLVGDAGYGFLFLALTIMAAKFLPKIPRRVIRLLLVMSCATIIWGALTGNYFGVAAMAGPLAELKLPWLTGEAAAENTMLLCFLLGAVHLSLAHLWNMVRFWPSFASLAQVGWLAMTWTMFFAARHLVLLEPFPPEMLYIFGAGVALVTLFMHPISRIRTHWFDYAMLPLTIISSFVDVVSYVRLFAVGAATYAVAAAFNQMALAAPGGFFSGFLAALILFFGHGLNILLAAMGVLVHGVRLNTLEFAGHMGLAWSGRPYAPFKSVKKTEDKD